MKKIFFQAIVLLVALVFVGCAMPRVIKEPSGSSREAGVPDNPPEPKEEVAGTAPGPNYVWVAGYWSWPGEWKWVPGSWQKQPSPNSTYVNGHWVERNEYWAWVPGYWKEPIISLPK